jgi:UDP-N-acetylmuramyl tripeptide synthase
MFEKKRVRRIFGSRGERTRAKWRIMHGNEELHMLNVIE